jgi:hypothetical protein
MQPFMCIIVIVTFCDASACTTLRKIEREKSGTKATTCSKCGMKDIMYPAYKLPWVILVILKIHGELL